MADAQSSELRLADTGAPVVLVTGLPGAGKTLFCLAEFAVGRDQVYQYGVDGCPLPECQPEKWSELPKGATLIVDEAWNYFPPKNANQDPPDHYKIGEIRHTGVSLVLITQHPNDIDARVRRRVGRHVHLVRVFGTEESVVHQKNEAFDVETRSETVTRRWPFPKQVYKLYKSAEMHRAKPQKPWRYRLIPLMWLAAPLLLVAGLAYTYFYLLPSKPAEKPGQVNQVRTMVQSPGQAAPGVQKVVDVRTWLEARQPRLPGLTHTAPVYDGVTEPKDAPYPAACVQSRTRCECFTQQGTVMRVGPELCADIVRNGFFVDWQEREASQDRGKPLQAVPGPSAPLSGGSPGQSSLLASTPGTFTDDRPRLTDPPGAIQDGEAIRFMRSRAGGT